MSKFIQIGDNLVINLEAVASVFKFEDGKVSIAQKGTAPLTLEGKQATAVWAYFTATSPNMSLPITEKMMTKNSGQNALSIPNSNDAIS